MLYRPFGQLGWSVSAIGMGTWNIGNQWGQLDDATSWATVRAAFDHGVNLFDTAESYGIPNGLSEERLGVALAGIRHQVYVVSKIGHWGVRTGQGVPKTTVDMIRLCAHASLHRLRTDWHDVLLCHENDIADPGIYLEAFEALHQEGRLRAYGISTDSLEVLRRFNQHGTCRVVEIDYSLLNRAAEAELLAYCEQQGMAVLVRGPLAMGLLSGKYSSASVFDDAIRGNWNEGQEGREAFLRRVAQAEKLRSDLPAGEEMITAALRYVISHPAAPVAIPGAKSPQQAQMNAAATRQVARPVVNAKEPYMRTIIEPSQAVPVVAEVDVAVVGGGTAGIGAALGAARAGASVVLIEAHGSLGGQMTLGQVNMIPGNWDYAEGSPTYGGVMTELVVRLLAENAYWPRERLTKQFKHFDIEVCKCVAIEMLEAAGVQMRLHSWASNAVVKEGRIEAVVVASVAGRQAVVARSFVDASGDAILAHLAGASYETGAMGISLEATACLSDPAALWAFCEKLDQPLHDWLRTNGHPVYVGGAFNERSPHLNHISRTFPTPGQMSGDIDGLDPALLTHVENRGRRDLRAAVEFLRAQVPGCEDLFLADTRPHLGVRSTRRVTGDYAVTAADMADRTHFADCVVRSGTPEGFYQIPHRALYSRDVANLWVGGRCFSATHEAQTKLRIIPTCVATGEAAGTAAGLAAHAGCAARDLPSEALIDQLIKQGVALRDQVARVP